MYAGIDAYMDAPRHCIQNARSVDEIKLDKLFMQCYVINTSAKCNETYIVTTGDIHEYENTYGTITAKSCVMLYTGLGFASRIS